VPGAIHDDEFQEPVHTLRRAVGQFVELHVGSLIAHVVGARDGDRGAQALQVAGETHAGVGGEATVEIQIHAPHDREHHERGDQRELHADGERPAPGFDPLGARQKLDHAQTVLVSDRAVLDLVHDLANEVDAETALAPGLHVAIEVGRARTVEVETSPAIEETEDNAVGGQRDVQPDLSLTVEVGVTDDVGACFLESQKHAVHVLGGQMRRTARLRDESPDPFELALFGGKLRDHLARDASSPGHGGSVLS